MTDETGKGDTKKHPRRRRRKRGKKSVGVLAAGLSVHDGTAPPPMTIVDLPAVRARFQLINQRRSSHAS